MKWKKASSTMWMLFCSLVAAAVGLHVSMQTGGIDTIALVAEVDIDFEDLEEGVEDDLENATERWQPHPPSAATPSAWQIDTSFARATSAAEGWRSRPTRPPTT
jgi:hypothetical protein